MSSLSMINKNLNLRNAILSFTDIAIAVVRNKKMSIEKKIKCEKTIYS